MVTAAREEIPQPLIDQLAQGGRLIVPVGKPAIAGFFDQHLLLITKLKGKIEREPLLPVAFVPMTGKPR
jgi:protein-L-isoaspartate(D-aspartate) O-methyltransferase